MLSPESNIAFYVGTFGVRYYSLIMFVAILAGSFLSCIIAKKYYPNVSIDKFLDILPIIILSAILGARIYYVFMDWTYYSTHLIEILAIQKGGLSIHGALIGGFLSGYLCIKKYKLDLWQYADIFAYGLLLGQIIGRIGNYFNIEAFGKPCFYSDNLCLYIPEIYRPLAHFQVKYFHPTFLYEMLWNILVLLVLFFIIRKLTKNIDGIIFFSYLILYSIGRFFIEGIRLDSVLNFYGIHIAQIVSIFIIILSIFMICYLKNKIKSE